MVVVSTGQCMARTSSGTPANSWLVGALYNIYIRQHIICVIASVDFWTGTAAAAWYYLPCISQRRQGIYEFEWRQSENFGGL